MLWNTWRSFNLVIEVLVVSSSFGDAVANVGDL